MIEPVSPIGESPEWLEALEKASFVAPLDRPILVIGERGTGKELIGERLHFLSRRWNGPFIKVNCAALSEELLDSELFGHEQGAFTGATSRRIGRFEQADGGTIFLDEIATASQRVQEKLLRVIEYGEFQRLGGENLHRCDVRVSAATNIDLPNAVEDGKFRADLLDRLAFDVITLPPLRVRIEDISLLADHFGSRLARELGFSFPGFSASAILALEAHDWPGNVRELKNVAERLTHFALQRSPSDPIEFVDGAIDPFNSPFRPQAPRKKVEAKPAAPQEFRLDVPPVDDQGLDFEAETRLYEVRLLEMALKYAEGHQGKAAEFLDLTYHQLRGLLRKHDMDNKKKRGEADDPPARTPIRGM
ncbi:phage shock protein operon transcriptional activator [Ponticaulis sp.]|uniref:phage shock protein operon transcriptional activator n=1 Tax=Ponticaulis sp. TaxID=2020902 RepID=UPI000B640636|nr:phage shock protein operon transcriptional activator [Ponticaulis sp.]MAI90996.1 phage shock protein operon transcriptional activator [Ponticaulis sp.]OUX98336.1 MAG: phage shock protein operon transcriptional activator [Hyphomonadaceae bacterium TMED5]|tara:strand:+ start:142449 stop:143534 length:1086 start_codon:yes stop_codon:yes gene_type:complete